MRARWTSSATAVATSGVWPCPGRSAALDRAVEGRLGRVGGLGRAARGLFVLVLWLASWGVPFRDRTGWWRGYPWQAFAMQRCNRRQGLPGRTWPGGSGSILPLVGDAGTGAAGGRFGLCWRGGSGLPRRTLVEFRRACRGKSCLAGARLTGLVRWTRTSPVCFVSRRGCRFWVVWAAEPLPSLAWRNRHRSGADDRR